MYSERVCFIALVIQHKMRMRRIILSCVPFPSVLPFLQCVSQRHYFRGGGGGEVIEHKMCVLIFSTTFV